MSTPHTSPEEYYEPGRYEIRLKGHLDARWADQFEHMSFTHASDGTTILAGPVVDQAALYGLLRKVRDLGLPLLSVVQIGPERKEPRTKNQEPAQAKEQRTENKEQNDEN